MVKTIPKYTTFPIKRFYKNVAVYCRVSTLQEIQHNSLEAQRSYYTKYIENQPGWVLVEIYAGSNFWTKQQKDGSFSTDDGRLPCRENRFNSREIHQPDGTEYS